MALVQGTAADTGSTASATLTATFGTAMTAGSLLAVVVQYSGGTCAVASNGQTITSRKKSAADGNGYFIEGFALENINGGGTTVVATFSPNEIGAMICIEESGVATTSALDGTPNSASPGSTTAWTTGSTTTLNATDVIFIGGSGTTSPSTTNTAFGGGFSAVTGTNITSGYHQNTVDGDCLAMGRQVTSSASIYSGSGTWAASQASGGIIMAFKLLSTTSLPQLTLLGAG